jgi:hypothetical protein
MTRKRGRPEEVKTNDPSFDLEEGLQPLRSSSKDALIVHDWRLGRGGPQTARSILTDVEVGERLKEVFVRRCAA